MMGLAVTAAGCAPAPGVGGAAAGPAARGPLEVRAADVPFTYADGAVAKRQADAQCGPRGVRTSIYDRFDEARAVWIFVEGCA
jgi:hypothetical protein